MTKVADKFEFNPGNRMMVNNNDSIVSKMQVQLTSLIQWAGMVENRMQQYQESLLNLVGSFDGLVGMLVNNETVTVEAITEKRELFLQRVREIQEEARIAREQQSSTIWTPPSNKIVSPTE